MAAAGAAHALRAQTPPAVPPEDPEYVIPDYLIDPRVSMPTAEVEGYDYIGVLSIPVLDLELPVMDSWSYPQLKLSPCRYEGSAAPQPGEGDARGGLGFDAVHLYGGGTAACHRPL